MTAVECPICHLRFATRTELEWHARTDHHRRRHHAEGQAEGHPEGHPAERPKDEGEPGPPAEPQT